MDFPAKLTETHESKMRVGIWSIAVPKKYG